MVGTSAKADFFSYAYDAFSNSYIEVQNSDDFQRYFLDHLDFYKEKLQFTYQLDEVNGRILYTYVDAQGNKKEGIEVISQGNSLNQEIISLLSFLSLNNNLYKISGYGYFYNPNMENLDSEFVDLLDKTDFAFNPLSKEDYKGHYSVYRVDLSKLYSQLLGRSLELTSYEEFETHANTLFHSDQIFDLYMSSMGYYARKVKSLQEAVPLLSRFRKHLYEHYDFNVRFGGKFSKEDLNSLARGLITEKEVGDFKFGNCGVFSVAMLELGKQLDLDGVVAHEGIHMFSIFKSKEGLYYSPEVGDKLFSSFSDVIATKDFLSFRNLISTSDSTLIGEFQSEFQKEYQKSMAPYHFANVFDYVKTSPQDFSDNNIYFFGDNSQRALLLKETLGTKYDVQGISGNFAVSFNVTNYVNAQNHESNQLGFNVVNALSDRFRISNDTDIVVANYSNLLFSMSVEKFLNEIRGKESNSYDDIGRMDIALRNDLFFGVSHNNSSFKTTMGISLISDFQTESVLYQKPKRYSGIGSYAYIEKPLFEDYTINVEATQKRFAKTQQDFLKLGIKTGGFEINAGNIKVNYDNDFVQNFIANVNQTFVELKNKNFSLKLVKDEKDSLDDNYKVNVNYSAKF